MFRHWWLKYGCFRYLRRRKIWWRLLIRRWIKHACLGIGGEDRFGPLYVPVTIAAGDLAFGGDDGLWCCRISRMCSSRVASAVK